jgi:hypothetical protein
MGEFLGTYGFFILIALFMVICHPQASTPGGSPRDPDHEGGTQGGSPCRRSVNRTTRTSC